MQSASSYLYPRRPYRPIDSFFASQPPPWRDAARDSNTYCNKAASETIVLHRPSRFQEKQERILEQIIYSTVAIMDEIDRIASRVTIATCFGALAGVGTAMFKGHPMARTVGLTAFSCAMTGTACFGAERCASVLTKRVLQRNDNEWETVLGTHAMGGLLGGSILGGLYIGKPIHGVVFFVPFMLLVGTGEKLFYDVREERNQRLHREAKDQ